MKGGVLDSQAVPVVRAIAKSYLPIEQPTITKH